MFDGSTRLGRRYCKGANRTCGVPVTSYQLLCGRVKYEEAKEEVSRIGETAVNSFRMLRLYSGITYSIDVNLSDKTFIIIFLF